MRSVAAVVIRMKQTYFDLTYICYNRCFAYSDLLSHSHEKKKERERSFFTKH